MHIANQELSRSIVSEIRLILSQSRLTEIPIKELLSTLLKKNPLLLRSYQSQKTDFIKSFQLAMKSLISARELKVANQIVINLRLPVQAERLETERLEAERGLREEDQLGVVEGVDAEYLARVQHLEHRQRPAGEPAQGSPARWQPLASGAARVVVLLKLRAHDAAGAPRPPPRTAGNCAKTALCM